MNVVCCLISKLVLIISFKVQTKSLTISKIKVLRQLKFIWTKVRILGDSLLKKIVQRCIDTKWICKWRKSIFKSIKNLIKRRNSEWRVVIIFFFKKGNSERYLIRCEWGIIRSTLYHATILLQLKHDVSWSKQTPRRS